MRDVLGAEGPELGDRHLEVGEHLEQEGLERLVGPVHLVDEQHSRAPGARDGAQERPLEEIRPAEHGLLQLRGALALLLVHARAEIWRG